MKTWKSQFGNGHVNLTDDNLIEIVYGNLKEIPSRLVCGRIVYSHPSNYPKSLVRKVFDALWFDNKPASNDHMSLLLTCPKPKKKLLW